MKWDLNGWCEDQVGRDFLGKLGHHIDAGEIEMSP
jgi:hypothetical protein